jgi:hypothetical protein
MAADRSYRLGQSTFHGRIQKKIPVIVPSLVFVAIRAVSVPSVRSASQTVTTFPFE